MKKVLVVLAVVLFSVTAYNCTEDSIAQENETYATGKECDGSPGDKDGCEED